MVFSTFPFSTIRIVTEDGDKISLDDYEKYEDGTMIKSDRKDFEKSLNKLSRAEKPFLYYRWANKKTAYYQNYFGPEFSEARPDLFGQEAALPDYSFISVEDFERFNTWLSSQRGQEGTSSQANGLDAMSDKEALAFKNNLEKTGNYRTDLQML